MTNPARKHRSPAASALLLVLLVVGGGGGGGGSSSCRVPMLAQAHPICVDGAAPNPYPAAGGAFCRGPPVTWDGDEGTCCTLAEHESIAAVFDDADLSLAPDPKQCARLLKEHLCQPCNPFAGHIFVRGRPFSCETFVELFTEACGKELRGVYKIVPNSLGDEFYCSPFHSSDYYSNQKPPMLHEAYPGLRGLLPPSLVQAVPVPDTDLWWAVSKTGTVVEFEGSADADSITVVVDIRDRVVSDATSETGLLSLAFSPDFAKDGKFYLNYICESPKGSDGIATRISRFSHVEADGWPCGDMTAGEATRAAEATAESEEVILQFKQPFANHNGGWMGFGAEDGYLYIATGDGGSQPDPFNNAQNTTSLLGKILRIDVRPLAGSALDRRYSVPDSNPFDGVPGGNPVWAFGLRNPWRCSFDRGGRLWCGDVGWDTAEEINVIVEKGNFGWKRDEGYGPVIPVDDGSEDDRPTGVLPKFAYCHSEDQTSPGKCDGSVLGKSVIGGFLYRGKKYPKLRGQYVFGDYEAFSLVTLNLHGDGWVPRTLIANTGVRSASFAEGADGELYIVQYETADASMIYHFACGEYCDEVL